MFWIYVHVTKSDDQEAFLLFRHVKGDPGFKFPQSNLLFWPSVAWFCLVSPSIYLAENCALLDFYTASIGNFLPTFRDNLPVPSPGVKNPLPLKMGPIGCPETSVRNYQYSLRSHLLRCGSLKSRIFSWIILQLKPRLRASGCVQVHCSKIFSLSPLYDISN